MRAFTKEQLIKIIQHRISVASGFPESEKAQIELELARIALASLEAEAVGFIAMHKETGKFGSYLHPKADWFKNDEYEVLSAYTAPPAPVVPDEREAFEAFMADKFGDTIDYRRAKNGDQGYMAWDMVVAWIVWQRRAAMQGKAEPVSQPYKLRDGVETLRNSGIAIDAEKILAERDARNTPDCWCRTCRPITITDMRFVVCPECGNKRCPHANDHRNACTGSNEPGQEGSAYPAAPQQEAE
jgi:hypothetical protein